MTLTKFKKEIKGGTNRRSQLCIVLVRRYKSYDCVQKKKEG